MNTTIETRLMNWLLSHDRGTSSETIVQVMTNTLIPARADVPGDASDFGRCYRLLKQIPEFRKRLNEVSKVYTFWKPFVDHWDELTIKFESDDENDWTIVDLIRSLNEESENIRYNRPIKGAWLNCTKCNRKFYGSVGLCIVCQRHADLMKEREEADDEDEDDCSDDYGDGDGALEYQNSCASSAHDWNAD